MSLNPQTELAALEAAYLSIVSGTIKAYTVNGRSVTKLDLPWLTQRMDQLRLLVYRQNNGMFTAARFRNPE